MTPTSAAPGLILALDLGKYKSVACLYQGDPANARFDSFTTDRQHLRQLFARHSPTVVIEACALPMSPRMCERMGGAAYPDCWADTAEGVARCRNSNRRVQPEGVSRREPLGLERGPGRGIVSSAPPSAGVKGGAGEIMPERTDGLA
jgi:hypothetical protein